MKLKKTYWIIIGFIVLLLGLIIFWPDSQGEKLYTKVQKGNFRIDVKTSGELKAKRSEDIKGPAALRSNGIHQIKITDLIAEGSYVEKGSYIAQLDKSPVAEKIIVAAIEVEKFISELQQAKLDTAIKMIKLRDDLLNMNYEIEEKKLVFEQSTYEAPAVKRQAEIDMEKINRKYNQAIKSYKLEKRQNQAKVNQVQISLKQRQNILSRLEQLAQELTILAPKDGMLIYKRDWDGNKVIVGSQISSWSPTVATLPDLSKMVSKTYVNEIDISHLKKGLLVDITVDAFPDKNYTGIVVDVANVGEQLPNSDAKVFEVLVDVNEKDDLLRPAMTTNNQILINELHDVLFVSQEAVFINDSINYVIIKSTLGLERQQVDLGETNDNFVVIKSGLTENERLLMVKPDDAESISWR